MGIAGLGVFGGARCMGELRDDMGICGQRQARLDAASLASAKTSREISGKWRRHGQTRNDGLFAGI